MDPRRHMLRTDAVLADPRLIAARERLGGSPAKAALAATSSSITGRAEAKRLAAAGVDCQVVPTTASVGSGGAPGVSPPGAALSLPQRLVAELRLGGSVRRGDMPAAVAVSHDARE